MRISVIGVGHVGLVSAAAFALWGHDVVGMDDDADRIAGLRDGVMPFFEPGLEELVEEGAEAGRLRFVGELVEAVEHAEVVFVCVGTPPLPGGGPNLSFVEAVGRGVAQHATRELVLVEKSTVPANTGRRLAQVISHELTANGSQHAVHVASNPEFLREGVAVDDTLHPDRIVYGTSTSFAQEALRRIYEPVVSAEAIPVVETDVPTAELIKHASNAFLATRLSFINAVAQICERVGADVEVVAEGMGYDARIGHSFLKAGLGYGGSCFPKDVDAFAHLARQVGYDFRLLDEVRAINAGQRDLVLSKLEGELWNLEGKTVTLLGAAFKPGTDDLREAPAVHLARELVERGATVRVYDPVALDRMAATVEGVVPVDDPVEACRGAHAAVVATEWSEVAALTPEQFLEALTYPVVVDGRNVYDPDKMLDSGIHYHSIGRRSIASSG